MIINRASEMAVVVGTQHPVHVVLGALQMVLAVAAGVLFAYADGTCHRIANAFDDNCSIVMICFVIFICEVRQSLQSPQNVHGNANQTLLNF